MSHADVITLPRFVARLPNLIGGLPGLLKGLRVGNPKDTGEPLGLAYCLESAVRANPNGAAVIQGGTCLSYAEFNGWANRMAHYLVSQGIHKGDTVAVMLENRPELLAVVAACAKVGAIAAMVNTSQRGQVLIHSINLVKPRLAIVGEELIEAYMEANDELTIADDARYFLADRDTRNSPGVEPMGWHNLAKACRAMPDGDLATSRLISADDPCFYVYTSGTTGMPKAVIFNHGRFMKAYGAFGFGAVKLKRDDRMYVTLPFYHATGLVVCWGSVLASGACLIMARKFSARRFWDDVNQHGATAFGYVGELCRYLMDQPEQASDRNNKVRVMVGNGLRPSVWKDFKRRFGVARVVEFYASSEGNIGFTNVLNFDNTVGLSPFPYAIVSYDKEKEAPVRDGHGRMIRVRKGEAGLLIGQITEKTPFHGYTDPGKTEKSVLRNVFTEGDAWFDTGDMMRDIGFKHAQFVDRLGDTFRWKGENVSTTEVEAVLDAVDHVNEAVVYGVEIPHTNGRAGMASIRLDCPAAAFDFKALLHQLKQTLPPYAIPVFLRLSEKMETTGTFKHLKAPLKAQGFDLAKQDNPVLVWLPRSATYVPLTKDIQLRIEAGDYRY